MSILHILCKTFGFGNYNGQSQKTSATSHQSDNDQSLVRSDRHHHHHHHHHHHAHQHQESPGLFSNNRSANSRQSASVTHTVHGRHHHSHSRGNTSHTGTRLSQLGYTKRKTSEGQVYFVDKNGNRDWHDPTVPKELLNAQLDLDSLIGPLSSNWEVRRTSSGKKYYANHTKLTTQLTDPRLVAYKDVLMSYLRHTNVPNNAPNNVSNNASNNVSNNVSNIAPINTSCRSRPTADNANASSQLQQQQQQQQHMTSLLSGDSFHNLTITSADLTFSENNRSNNRKEFYDKISILRQELMKQQDLSNPCKISINRKKIFEESFRAVSQMVPSDLKKRLLIKFRGEEGLDYGGVAREWFYLLSKEILNPAHGLFQYTGDDIYNLQINPDSGIVYREHLAYLNFCGRIMGLAVFHGHFIEGRFTLPFYKMLLNKSIILCDIENVDPELYRSLCWILENDITNVIDTTFSVQHNAFGQLQEYELKENGRNINVTEQNKWEYVSLYVNYRCRRGIENQFGALQRGFYEVISQNLVKNFDEYELELLIGGLSKIDIDDWRTYTKLKNCTIETPLVLWFWDIVKSYDEDKRARLLQFVTGSPRVPIQGFKALQGVNSELRLFTIHMIRNGNTDNLPKSHTCFNRIDLPPYETYDKLHDKLTQAIEETMGFAMQ